MFVAIRSYVIKYDLADISEATYCGCFTVYYLIEFYFIVRITDAVMIEVNGINLNFSQIYFLNIFL